MKPEQTAAQSCYSNGKTNVSAFDLKFMDEDSPDQIAQPPPQPEKLVKEYDLRQAMMNTGDWRLSECLKHSIDAFSHNTISVKVEDLITKVKMESSSVAPLDCSIATVKAGGHNRQSLVLQDTSNLLVVNPHQQVGTSQ